MKLASNFKGDKNVALSALSLIKEGKTADYSHMFASTGCKYGNELDKFVQLGEMFYKYTLNKNGNLSTIYPHSETYKGREEKVGKYEVIGQYTTFSDCGSHLINGLLFNNGYGDGYNTVEIRKFSSKFDQYHSRAEIYSKPNIIIPGGSVKVWETDVENPSKDTPLLILDNCFKIIINGRKLILCVW